MTTMSKHTGRALPSREALQQSLNDVLMTPLGSRVMRRDYGSILPDLIDQPLNEATELQLYSGVVMAQLRWEPRIRIQRMQRRMDPQTPGATELLIEAVRLDTSTPQSIQVSVGGQ